MIHSMRTAADMHILTRPGTAEDAGLHFRVSRGRQAEQPATAIVPADPRKSPAGVSTPRPPAPASLCALDPLDADIRCQGLRLRDPSAIARQTA